VSWWSILKSSRDEAYAAFVKEYGPEVDLDSLEVLNTQGIKQVQIFPDEDSEWFITYDVLSSGKEQFTFESMSNSSASLADFVEGMFEMEYPERYEELLEMAKGALPQTKQSRSSKISIPLSYELIVELIAKKIRDVGILDTQPYTTIHDAPFYEVVDMALRQLKEITFVRGGTNTQKFYEVLDLFCKSIYFELQADVLNFEDSDFRVTVAQRRSSNLRTMLKSAFVVPSVSPPLRATIVRDRSPSEAATQAVLSIIDLERNAVVQ